MTDIVERLRGLVFQEEWLEEAAAEIERLKAGLDAAIRAANLAIFVIRKQGVMPNSSWEAGFAKDLATAEAAKAGYGQATTKENRDGELS